MVWISWLAFIVGAVGLALAAKKSYGWFMSGTGSLLWVIYAIITVQYALMITAAIWLIIEWRNGYITLKKERDDKKNSVH